MLTEHKHRGVQLHKTVVCEAPLQRNLRRMQPTIDRKHASAVGLSAERTKYWLGYYEILSGTHTVPWLKRVDTNTCTLSFSW